MLFHNCAPLFYHKNIMKMDGMYVFFANMNYSTAYIQRCRAIQLHTSVLYFLVRCA